MTGSDIVVVGEALIDLTTSGDGVYRAHPGGGPANAAVALGRLGARPSFIGRLSKDQFGDELAQWLEGNDVDLSRSVRCDENSTLAVASLGADGGASYTFYANGTVDWQWVDAELPADLTGAAALHFGSLASRVEPGASRLEAFRARCADEVTTFVDPNFRAQLDTPSTARQKLEHWLAVCDIVKLSVDDLAFACPGEDPFACAAGWAANSAHVVLLTDGARGAHAIVNGAHLSCTAPSARVVDTIGAGDCFGAAFLYALQCRGALTKGADRQASVIGDALRFACACAAITCERAGADTPRLDELPPAIVALLGSPTGESSAAR